MLFGTRLMSIVQFAKIILCYDTVLINLISRKIYQYKIISIRIIKTYKTQRNIKLMLFLENSYFCAKIGFSQNNFYAYCTFIMLLTLSLFKITLFVYVLMYLHIIFLIKYLISIIMKIYPGWYCECGRVPIQV